MVPFRTIHLRKYFDITTQSQWRHFSSAVNFVSDRPVCVTESSEEVHRTLNASESAVDMKIAWQYADHTSRSKVANAATYVHYFMSDFDLSATAELPNVSELSCLTIEDGVKCVFLPHCRRSICICKRMAKVLVFAVLHCYSEHSSHV